MPWGHGLEFGLFAPAGCVCFVSTEGSPPSDPPDLPGYRCRFPDRLRFSNDSTRYNPLNTIDNNNSDRPETIRLLKKRMVLASRVFRARIRSLVKSYYTGWVRVFFPEDSSG